MIENEDEKLERYEAKKYLHGFMRYPGLRDDERHKKAYEYAKRLQINYIRGNLDLGISDEALFSLIETMFPYEDRNNLDKYTLDNMEMFVRKRKNLFKEK